MGPFVRSLMVLGGVFALVACTVPAQVVESDEDESESAASEDEDEDSDSDSDSKSKGSSTKGTDKSKGTGKTTTTSSSSSGGTSSTKPSTPAPKGEFAACAAMTSTSSCETCCGATENGDAADAAFEACVCDTTCADVCGDADYCSDDGDELPACEACVAAKCEPVYEKECAALPSCAKFEACYAAAKCDDMEQD